MNLRTQLRTLATAAAIGVAIIGSSAGLALAAPNTTPQGQCESNGGVWDAKKKGCATKQCTHDGGYYKHNETVTVPGTGPGLIKLRTTYKCNGFTGQWEQVASIQASQTEPPAPADVPVLSR